MNDTDFQLKYKYIHTFFCKCTFCILVIIYVHYKILLKQAPFRKVRKSASCYSCSFILFIFYFFLQIDKELCSRSYVYESFRNKGSIQPIKVHQVKVGTFEELRKFTIDNSQASANQYKVPRVLKTKEAVSVLLKNVVNEL